MVKDARASYFANLISSSKRNTKKTQFDNINNIVTPAHPDVFSNKDFSNFLSFFMPFR